MRKADKGDTFEQERIRLEDAKHSKQQVNVSKTLCRPRENFNLAYLNGK